MFRISDDNLTVYIDQFADFLDVARFIGPRSRDMFQQAKVYNTITDQFVGNLWGRNNINVYEVTNHTPTLTKTLYWKRYGSLNVYYSPTKSPFYTFFAKEKCLLIENPGKVVLIHDNVPLDESFNILRTVFCCNNFNTVTITATEQPHIPSNEELDYYYNYIMVGTQEQVMVKKPKKPTTPPPDMLDTLTKLFGPKIAKTLVAKIQTAQKEF